MQGLVWTPQTEDRLITGYSPHLSEVFMCLFMDVWPHARTTSANRFVMARKGDSGEFLAFIKLLIV